jgi:hypothetical protein
VNKLIGQCLRAKATPVALQVKGQVELGSLAIAWDSWKKALLRSENAGRFFKTFKDLRAEGHLRRVLWHGYAEIFASIPCLLSMPQQKLHTLILFFHRLCGVRMEKIYPPLSFLNARAHQGCKIAILKRVGRRATVSSISKTRMIPHPCCELCDADMCIEPDKPGHDMRTFECPRCQHLKVEIVNYSEQNE